MQKNIRSNFDMLKAYEPQLWRLGALAERYFAEDPNTSLLKQRQFAELLAQSLAARGGLYTSQDESQYELIRRLHSESLVPQEIKQVFDQIRITGNAANHALAGDHAKALTTLKLAWQLSLWFHRTFKQADFHSGPFLPPAPPEDEPKELHVAICSANNPLRRQYSDSSLAFRAAVSTTTANLSSEVHSSAFFPLPGKGVHWLRS
jgi:type I restriction enzyme R subunit